MICFMQISGITCFYKYFLGFECPGCGMTRACLAVLRFDFVTAVSYHPLCFIMPVAAMYILFDGHPYINKKVNNTVLICIGIAFLLNYLIKILL